MDLYSGSHLNSHAQTRPTAKSTDRYNPAVLKLIYSVDPTKPNSSVLDTILIPVQGEAIARRSTLDPRQFATTLRTFYSEVASLRPIETDQPTSPARRLHDLLIGPLEQELKERKITTLLISANPGLQAVPFAALHDGDAWFGSRFSFSLTPSLSLMPKQEGSRGENNGIARREQASTDSRRCDGGAGAQQISKIRAGSTYQMNSSRARYLTHSRVNQGWIGSPLNPR